MSERRSSHSGAEEPEYEYDLDAEKHNEMSPPLRGGEHGKEFFEDASVLRSTAEGGR